MASQPRHVLNSLQPIPLDAQSLTQLLEHLQRSIVTGVQLIRTKERVHSDNSDAARAQERAHSHRDRERDRESLYIGQSDASEFLVQGDFGIALMLLRLAVQSRATGLATGDATATSSSIVSDFSAVTTTAAGPNLHLNIRPGTIRSYLPHIRSRHPQAGHLSPLDSAVGPALVYLLTALAFPTRSQEAGSPAEAQFGAALATLRRAVCAATEEDALGGDEVLYGRAGLLMGMLNVRAWLKARNSTLSERHRVQLEEVAGDTVLEGLVRDIVDAGEVGAKEYVRAYGAEGLPLMWPWNGKFYLGAIHGVAGILTVLLQAPRDLIKPRLPVLTATISGLCALTLANNGHLPSSLPPSRRGYSLVQICHGSPGLLLLLAALRARFPTVWSAHALGALASREDLVGEEVAAGGGASEPEAAEGGWEAAEAVALQRVWDEGVLCKGLGVCHGVSGNGWAVLLGVVNRADDPPDESRSSADETLSRALALLKLATYLPPIDGAGDLQRRPSATGFRTPDHPFSLFEGLAGAVCAWADACVVIRARLARMNAAGRGEVEKEAQGMVLGVPGLGAGHVRGIL